MNANHGDGGHRRLGGERRPAGARQDNERRVVRQHVGGEYLHRAVGATIRPAELIRSGVPPVSEPYRLLPQFHERIWGLRDLSRWFPGTEFARPVGEAWFSPHPLDDAAFPLLLKFLFTTERLSVQVHPGDEYARKHHGSLGKTEAWHIVEAQPGAEIALGFRGPLTQQRVRDLLSEGRLEAQLNWIPVRAGETYLVPAGTVHAIGAGLTIVEVQEHSDITYRLYDYGRPRELHLERALEVADLGPYRVDNTGTPLGPGRRLLTACRYFAIEHWKLPEAGPHATGSETHRLVVCLSGEGLLAGKRFAPGEVWLAPAGGRNLELRSEDAGLLVAVPMSAS